MGKRLGPVVLLAPLAGCLDIFTRITNEGRKIVDYTNDSDGTSTNKSANGLDRNVDTGSAEIPLPVARICLCPIIRPSSPFTA